MWIEKDMGERCTRGGALSQQVNDGIETLKRNNNLLFNGIGGNLLSEAKKSRYDERQRKLSRSTVLTASTKSGGSAVLTPSTRCWAVGKRNKQSLGKSKGGKVHPYRKGEKGKELPRGSDISRGDNRIDKTDGVTGLTDDGGNARNKNWSKLSSTHLVKEPQVTSSQKRFNQPMDKFPISGSEWKSRNVYDFEGTQYKNTQYLNNSAIYNDSIVNNETVVCQEWPEMSNPGDSAATSTTDRITHEECHLNNTDARQLNNREEGIDDPMLMAPLSKKQNHRTSIQDVIQKDIPMLIKNTVNNHLVENINYQVQKAIKKKLSNFLDHNGTDMSEKEAQKINTKDVEDKLSDLVNAEMKKNANHIYDTVRKRIQQDVNEEIERNTHLMNKQIEQNVSEQIETNLEKVYNQVDLKVGKKVSNELAKNMNSVQSNLLQNVNSELKRKVEFIGANVEGQVRVLISSELKRSLDFLHDRINENMNKGLKKCLSILSRNFDENLHEQMDRCVQIFLKHVCECLSEEIKNKVNVMEKNMIMNWDDHVLEKVTSRTQEVINRVQESMIIMDNTTNRTEEAIVLTKHIAEGISSEVRSYLDQLGTFVKEGISGDLKSGLQSLGKENEVASAKMTEVICAKVETLTSSELERQMGALLSGLREEVRDNMDRMEVTLRGDLKGDLKGSLEGILKRSVETTLKGSVEGSLKRSIESTLKGTLEETINRNLGETLKRKLETSIKGSVEAILREELSKSALMLNTDVCGEEAKKSDEKLETVLKNSNKNFDALIKAQKSLSTNLSKEIRVVKDVKTNMVDVKKFFKTCLTCLQEKLSDAMEKNNNAVINTSESILSRLDISFSGMDKILSSLCEKVIQRVGEANEKYAHRIAEEVGTVASNHHSFMKNQSITTEERLERLTQDILHLSEAIAQKTHERLRINNEDVLSTFINTVQTEKAHMITHAEEIMACLKKSVGEQSKNMLHNLRGLLNEKDDHMMEGLNRIRGEFDVKLGEQAKHFLNHLDRKIDDVVGGRVQCERSTDRHKHSHQVKGITLGMKQVKPLRVDNQKRYLIGSDMMAKPLGSTYSGKHRKTKCRMVWTQCHGTHGEMNQPNKLIGKNVNGRKSNQAHNDREMTRKRKPIYVVNYLRSKNNDLIEVAQHLHEKTKKIRTL
ncbi:conserved Plasmodium protein, unknown function [Plasmodium knowlesi strain H]|uniref:Uncharacterized protein n=3 Tax=Plasmodium knowlesi TaxID=5850 RepID=A0A5K1U1X9_PLAKH|nr:conserved Plasmodium protein, unknown function [Plasmodium knowlesi strain H]OTN65117.1 Uncharacterized protein PKNOH_S120137200 [Plasmodium knowlesi]CAA9988231.1 conserved Plasmodium protein, unknown function [Plasmodium knowlesi strain H]SBO20159.1 conserved Plasmodium protein, unknown function [Plasmodium knowlesi strain H]SBO20532.1 conserved Plasmodium protein, unknown function [Plasmodium knowlesi strain H]VVS77705.1 conserved Plasmodium protein, unknown function [Plasmodium knowlesi |eukprot:XP_002259208.1 hypothetical protein, conserved in Plasmodium species [Plasmodium knowlesi strain H]